MEASGTREKNSHWQRKKNHHLALKGRRRSVEKMRRGK